jgi:hypothetical protein
LTATTRVFKQVVSDPHKENIVYGNIEIENAIAETVSISPETFRRDMSRINYILKTLRQISHALPVS